MDFNFIPFDLHRMILGDGDLLFLLEIVVRTLVLFLYGVLLLHLLGKE